MKRQNLHLIISIFLIIPVALVYGFNPYQILTTAFDIKIDTASLSGIFKALMGLYISMAMLWLAGIIKPGWWAAATLVNIVFMSGLALGRIISIMLDGMPSPVFLIGLGVEILLATWGISNIKKYR